MNNEIKQNKKVKISELLHSILYPPEGLRQSDTEKEMPSQEGLKSRGEEKHKPRMLSKVKPAFLGLIVFFSGLVILLLFIIVTLAVLKDIEIQKRAQAESSLRELTRVNDNLQIRIDEYVAEIKFLRENLGRAKNLLAKSRDLIKEFLSSFKVKSTADSQLEQQFNDTKGMLVSVMGAKGEAIDAMEVSAAKNGERESEAVSIRSGLRLNGNVLIVDKQSGSVLVNLGKKDNLTAGVTLVVYRGNILIARLLVVWIDEKVSAARIVPSWRDISIIEEGDSVRSLE